VSYFWSCFDILYRSDHATKRAFIIHAPFQVQEVHVTKFVMHSISHFTWARHYYLSWTFLWTSSFPILSTVGLQSFTATCHKKLDNYFVHPRPQFLIHINSSI